MEQVPLKLPARNDLINGFCKSVRYLIYSIVSSPW